MYNQSFKWYEATISRHNGQDARVVNCLPWLWVQSIPLVSGTLFLWCSSPLQAVISLPLLFNTSIHISLLITWALYIDKCIFLSKFLNFFCVWSFDWDVWGFLDMSHLRPVYVLDINPCQLYLLQIFSHIVYVVFLLLMASFCCAKAFKFISFHFYFSSVSFCLGTFDLRKYCYNLCPKKFCLAFSSGRRPKQTYLPKKHMDDQQAQEKFAHHHWLLQECKSKPQCEVSPPTHNNQNGHCQKKSVRKREPPTLLVGTNSAVIIKKSIETLEN